MSRVARAHTCIDAVAWDLRRIKFFISYLGLLQWVRNIVIIFIRAHNEMLRVRTCAVQVPRAALLQTAHESRVLLPLHSVIWHFRRFAPRTFVSSASIATLFVSFLFQSRRPTYGWLSSFGKFQNKRSTFDLGSSPLLNYWPPPWSGERSTWPGEGQEFMNLSCWKKKWLFSFAL